MTRRSLLEGTNCPACGAEPLKPGEKWCPDCAEGKHHQIIADLAKENEELRAFLREYIERGWDGDHRFPMLHAEIKERATAILEREGL